MKCPYCENEMQNGSIVGDGRTKVHWVPEGEKYGLMDALAGKGRLDANYTFAAFNIEANYCKTCKKMIIDTNISK